MKKVLLAILSLTVLGSISFAGSDLTLNDLAGSYRILIAEKNKTMQVDYTVYEGMQEVRLAYRFIRRVESELDWGGMNCKAKARLVTIEGALALEIEQISCGRAGRLADLTVLGIEELSESHELETEMLVNSSRVNVSLQQINKRNFGDLPPLLRMEGVK